MLCRVDGKLLHAHRKIVAHTSLVSGNPRRVERRADCLALKMKALKPLEMRVPIYEATRMWHSRRHES
jgi:hypothetical protein